MGGRLGRFFPSPRKLQEPGRRSLLVLVTFLPSPAGYLVKQSLWVENRQSYRGPPFTPAWLTWTWCAKDVDKRFSSLLHTGGGLELLAPLDAGFRADMEFLLWNN